MKVNDGFIDALTSITTITERLEIYWCLLSVKEANLNMSCLIVISFVSVKVHIARVVELLRVRSDLLKPLLG